MTRPESWSDALEIGYQKYVRGKHAKKLTPRDREGWQVAVERWKHLKALGDGYRDSIYAELGCLRERGYTKDSISCATHWEHGGSTSPQSGCFWQSKSNMVRPAEKKPKHSLTKTL